MLCGKWGGLRRERSGNPLALHRPREIRVAEVAAPLQAPGLQGKRRDGGRFRARAGLVQCASGGAAVGWASGCRREGEAVSKSRWIALAVVVAINAAAFGCIMVIEFGR